MVHCTEFQAVVLAGGKGSRMTELTAGRPKCLLPIGNMPMIFYPLRLLERSGFHEAIVVVSESAKYDVAAAVDKLDLEIKLDFVGIPGGEDLGTADSIRLINEKIHVDFVVISCDLITEIDIADILNSYRKHNASITALIVPAPKVPDDFVTPGPKSKQKPETDLIGIDNETGRLVFLASASDFEETINLSRKLLKKHTSFTIHSKWMDAHLYVINKWVLDFLVFNKSFSTLKGELLPYIVAKQLSRPPRQSADDKNTSIVRLDTKEDIYRFAVEKPLDTLIRKMSAFNDHNTDLEEAYHGDVIRCYAHIVTGKFGLRTNTIQMYALANSDLSRSTNSEWWNTLTEGKISVPEISASATVKSTQVENCRIDENAFIDEKTSVKQNHIGPNVVIEPKTRISQSVIMGNVTIKQRCVITNCILCNGCVIQEGSEIKDCLVGAQHIVVADSRHCREVLTDVDRLMEI
ncbi:translation initiation factor eIF-2B subunit gamma isoform X2 [Cephus cinctus]|nr:translation initiation factor eIF-2B subunit gamma isoform X2 [Cephus cinctus]XP_024946928.1 translation initiation factor eIF-2B subunit gamma isoform X2 [Cephus cinctus]XP_024946929.1 translation initiation factor eIF-2B subunit gamma isoform X2 [Cephus cinctus]XP_024946930.1 translation initiation factor eIF-2B subunit gamma isoform X2 [Cephus cinctus]XP_024946931.1 translation initiation factor eIF-2B subunit gamma isoform X2 [Cephus cinctus]